jgi:serine/threonine protein kinase
MDTTNNRFTQLDIGKLLRAESPAKTTKPAVSLSSSLDNSSFAKKNVSSKKRARSPSDEGGPRVTTRTVQSKAARSATSGPMLVLESPWGKYEKVYGIDLGGPIEVAVRKLPPVELVHIRVFSSDASAKTLQPFRQLQHPNLVTILEAFTTNDGLYIVLEHMPISLEWIVRSPAYPNERQLAAILGQVSSFISVVLFVDHGRFWLEWCISQTQDSTSPLCLARISW